MPQPIRHIVFNTSGAASLRQALQSAGRNDDVVALMDDLSFGPIEPLDPSSRAKWIGETLGWDNWEEVAMRSFWPEALSPDHRKIAWTSRRSAMEFSGFLAWLSCLGPAPCEIVDLTDMKVSRRVEHGPPWPPHPVVGLGMLLAEQIRDEQLFSRGHELAPAERDRYVGLWTTLRAENAPLRVIENDTLVSADISFFDELLLSFATPDWRKSALVIGHALAFQTDDNIHQSGDLFLAARLNQLVEDGRLEYRGQSPLDLRQSEVRLTTARRATAERPAL